MTRFEENGSVIEEMTQRAKEKSSGTYEESVTFQLGVIATMLADISKSLAILAHKVTFQLGVIATMLADISKSLAILAHKAESEDKECIKLFDRENFNSF